MKFLVGPLRDDVAQLARGASIAQLSISFQEEVARLRFVPAVGRTIEAKHAVVTNSGKNATCVGPVHSSLSNRMPFAHLHRIYNYCI